MTALITCNFCHTPLELGYGNPNFTGSPILLNIQDDSGTLKFSAEIDLRANFNTTNVHWCRNCILKGLYKSIGEALNIYKGE